MRYPEEFPSSSSVVQHCNRMPRPASTPNADPVCPATSLSLLDDCNSRICRNLFGPIDHEENARFLSDQLNCMKKEAQQRWNFDFENEAPIPGRFEWTPVLVENRSQSVTTPNNPGRVSDDLTVDLKVKRDQNKEFSSTSFCHPQPQKLTDQPNSGVTVSRPLLRQTKITDHMPQQKRSHQSFQDSGDRLLGRTSKVHLIKRPKLLQTSANVLEAEWKQTGGKMNEAA